MVWQPLTPGATSYTAFSTGSLGIKAQQQQWRRSVTSTHLLATFLLHVPTVLCFALLEVLTQKKKKEKNADSRPSNDPFGLEAKTTIWPL